MIRKIVKINEEKCNGCGLCISGCHEGALQLINGKAKLVSESYCDGLGNCLPECPTGAITLEEREVAAFDEAAVKKNQAAAHAQPAPAKLACGCPGTHAKTIQRTQAPAASPNRVQDTTASTQSQLQQWPCQIKLVPVNAPYLQNSHLLIAADCAAYAYANIHQDFMRNKITLIGCPKLDNTDYAEKLAEIIRLNEIKSVTVLRMEVPCCSGLATAVKDALTNSGKMIPWQIVTIGTDGTIVDGN
jgi:ferredoxin